MRSDRRVLRREYQRVLSGVSEILFKHDPAGAAVGGGPPDEYDLEAATLLPVLKTCSNAADVQAALYREFVRWFGTEQAGEPNHYQAVAEEIWNLWAASILSGRSDA
jgi:hypothetical protein